MHRNDRRNLRDLLRLTEGAVDLEEQSPKTREIWFCASCGKRIWQPMWNPRRCSKCGLILCKSHLPLGKHNCVPVRRAFYRRYLLPSAIIVILAIVAPTWFLHSPEKCTSQRWLSIYGNMIVWTDNRTGDWDIYAYDRSSREERRITADPAKQRCPRIYANIIVWEDNRSGNYDVYAYDLGNGKEIQITSSPEDEGRPSIYEDLVLYQRGYGLCVYNLSNQEQREIWEGLVGSASISRDMVVWTHWHQQGDDIIEGISVCNLSTGEVQEITSGLEYDRSPARYGDIIAWLWGNRTIEYSRGISGPEQQILVYSISTKERKLITTDPVERMSLSIWKNTLVWREKRNGTWDIHMCDLTTGREMQMTSDPAEEVNPCLHDTTVAWQEITNGTWKVHLYDIVTGKEEEIP